jgi:hypothetical protein
MLIHDFHERKRISANNMLCLLNFLKDETYSDFHIIKKKLGFTKKSRNPVYKLLNKALKEGFIIKHEIPSSKRKLTVWGITMQGLAMVVKADDITFPSYFEPSKLKYWTLEHRLLNQRVRISLESKGATEWINGDSAAFIARYSGCSHRPDGIIKQPTGAIMAIETERTMKTRARYISIINSHLTARDKGNWHYALYVMPDTKSKESLIRLFDSIKTVMRNNTPVPFDEKNREMFIFRTIDELEQ